MASSSSSTSSRKRKYEVFLSFRGDDTRKTFVSHLHSALERRGIISFLDDDNIKHGQSISSELVKSIEESKFAIIVFSKDYASSKWCLEELVNIMKRKATNSLTVIPVFYDVDPADVRYQKNSFAKSFDRHKLRYATKVQIWKDNLTEAANLSGLDARGKNEAEFVEEIVKDIFNKLPRGAFTKGLVGMESRLTELRPLLFKNPDGVCFLGIWGLGGIGKTTIARAIFDDLINTEFKGQGCFLQDVRKHDMVSLQEDLLMVILGKPVKIRNSDDGSRMIRDRLQSKRVLLVLDDVDDVKQLQSLGGEREWFGAGSTIIVTTRDKHLLNEVDETYEVHLLSNSESKQLFCLHAFKNSSPPTDFVDPSRRIVHYARGLPLALEVLGCHLRKRTDRAFWDSTIKRLEDDQGEEIYDTLKISFDGLNDSQQRIFLDIACFYRGKPVDDVKRKLDAFGFHPEEGINVLIQKALLRIQKSDSSYTSWWILNERKRIPHETIEMHDLIQQMGRDIVGKEAKKRPERFTRLWREEDIIDVLEDSTATHEIEAVVLNQPARTINSMKVNQPARMIKLTEGAFESMNRLRLLEIHSREVRGTPNYLPSKLQWFHWVSYPAKSFPKSFEPRKLVGLELPCSEIKETPDFSAMPNLEVINLTNCGHLLQVHPSVGELKKLVQLLLRGCSQLESLPETIQTEVLEILDLENCVKLKNIPKNIKRCSHLQYLYLSSCSKLEALPDLPPSIKELDLDGCRISGIPDLVKLLGKHKDLRRLSLWGCWNEISHDWEFSKFKEIVPDFLLQFEDWECTSKALLSREEMLTVYVPGGHKIPKWFTAIAGVVRVTISLVSTSHDDELAGLALYTNTRVKLQCDTFNGQPSKVKGSHDMPWSNEHTAFIYIPIEKITSGWQDSKDGQHCLFEITACADRVRPPENDHVALTEIGIIPHGHSVWFTGMNFARTTLTILKLSPFQ